MTLETAQHLLERSQPRGLKRLVLAVLALDATAGGQLAFTDSDRDRLRQKCAMQDDRFSRIVEELRGDGFVSLDGTVLTVYDGEPTEGVEVQTRLLPASDAGSTTGDSVKGGAPPSQNAKSGGAVKEVLDFYDKTFGKSNPHGEDEKREVRAALQIRTVRQCKEAILGNKASAFHQGENTNGKKYNGISSIFRPKQGKKTRAEVIDYFIDVYKKAVGTTGSVKAGADPAIVSARKEEVRRAHRLRHDQEAQERGRRAVAWLAQYGIKTEYRPDGYPIWPQQGGDDVAP